MRKVVVYKGEVVSCPRCGLDLYTITRDCVKHERIVAEMFRGIGMVPNPQNGERCNCIECGASWMSGAHTPHIKGVGWV